jgi:hypothetical protein
MATIYSSVFDTLSRHARESETAYAQYVDSCMELYGPKDTTREKANLLSLVALTARSPLIMQTHGERFFREGYVLQEAFIRNDLQKRARHGARTPDAETIVDTLTHLQLQYTLPAAETALPKKVSRL